MVHNDFTIGKYRPIYLWAGPGTIRMNRLKFMDVRVDEQVHQEAHRQNGADIVTRQMLQNWVHLTYSWGFAPEIEQEDWLSFQQAAQVYHSLGEKVFAYIQTSNCVFEGSHRDRNWYALDSHGRKFYYYTNRFMTCLANPAWIKFLKDRIRGAIERGADGIFFDNLWHGTQPSALFFGWLGSAGCHCPSCRQAYLNESGFPLPESVDTSDTAVCRYLDWRSAQLTSILRELADYTRALKADVKISANDYDIVMRPSKLIYGIDFSALAAIQDVMMIENFCLPHWEPGKKTRFPNNAMTIRVAASLLPPDKPLSVLSYDAGIGFDPVYPARRILQGMAEAYALGATVTTKGTEYFNGREMTLITAPEYTQQRNAIAAFNRWISANEDFFAGRTNSNAVTLLNPGDDLWRNWFQLAPVFYGCMQTLTQAGIPWRVSTRANLNPADRLLLTFTEQDKDFRSAGPSVIQIHVPEIEGWKIKAPSLISRNAFIRKITGDVVEGLIRSYHRRRITRKIMDGLGMAKMVTQSPLFYLPEASMREALLESIPQPVFPRVASREPVLIQTWRTQSGETQIHLVNYARAAQTVSIVFAEKVNAVIQNPYDSRGVIMRESETFTFDLDIYAIILIRSDGGDL